MTGWYDSLSFDKKVAFHDRCRDWLKKYDKEQLKN